MHHIIYLPPYNDLNKWLTYRGVISDYGIRYTTNNVPYILYEYKNKIYIITYCFRDNTTYYEIWDPFTNMNMVKIKDNKDFIKALNTNKILINTKSLYPILTIEDLFTQPNIIKRKYKDRISKMAYMLTYINNNLVKSEE
jgi:hypothetical protein